MATRYSPSAENLRLLARKLQDGALVAVPTETVYGLAANAFNPSACARIFEVKERPAFDPLIVHLPEDFDLSEICVPNSAALRLAEKFWPGPLTIVLPKTAAVPDIVTAGLPSVAVRISAHPVFQALLRECRLPLAAPSANPFGYISPTTAAHVEVSLGDRIDSILDGGACAIGIESTIVDMRDAGDPVVLRIGGIERGAIEDALGLEVRSGAPPAAGKSEVMPGQLTSHYSPRSPTRVFEHGKIAADPPAPGVARIYFQRPEERAASASGVYWLSESGDTCEAAASLFGMLRKLDGENFNLIEAELAPQTGLGPAINDRLRRAAARTAG